MGTCTSKQSKPSQAKTKGKIEIHCPICQENYDTDDHKPYLVCSNKHKLCFNCLSSIKNHASLKKQDKIFCPFCKGQITEDLVQTDKGIYDFLEAELGMLKKLPQNRRKLFAFSSIYLPHLHRFIKEEVSGTRKQGSVESIETLRIRGKMVEEYETFQMEMLDCMTGLRKIYLSMQCFYLDKNQIKAIDITSFTHNKILLIDLSSNLITSVKNFMGEATRVFAYLKVLSMKNNMIEQATGINQFQHLQVANFSKNKLRSIKHFQGCKELRHLNLEYNEIAENVEFYSSFARLESLQLFGNPLALQTWEKFLRFSWKQLRLLTAYVKTSDLLQKYSIHKRINTMPDSRFLKLTIFEMGNSEPQNTNEIIDIAQKIKKEEKTPQSVELNSDSYLFYMENKSFLKDIFQKAIRFHPLGVNVNFKPYQPSKTSYQQDEKIYQYTKISNKTSPAQYLQSGQIVNTLKGKIFISFITKTVNLSIGIFERSQSNKKVELDFDKQTITINREELPCKALAIMKKPAGEVTTSMSLSVDKGSVEFIIDGVALEKYCMAEKWEEYRFFVNLKTKGQALRVIKNQIDLI